MSAQKKPLEGLAKAADHLFGDLFLGSVGRIAYHTAQVPVVGAACRYVGENLRDGYVAASQTALRKRLATAIIEAQNKAGKPLSSETMAAMAKDFGVPASSLDEIRKTVESMAKKPEQKPAFPTPATAAGAA